MDRGPTKDDTRCTEETWALLPDQTVLCLECDRQPRAEKYVMAANQWVSAGSTPVALVDTGSDEIGSALALPDGRVFCIGATANTALYTPPAIANQPGTWAAGPGFPVVVVGTGDRREGRTGMPSPQRPSAVRGRSVQPQRDGTWGSPFYIYEYDPVANTLTQAPSPPNGSAESVQLAADSVADRPSAAHERELHRRDLHARRRARSVVEAVDHVGADRAPPGSHLRAARAADQRTLAGGDLR